MCSYAVALHGGKPSYHIISCWLTAYNVDKLCIALSMAPGAQTPSFLETQSPALSRPPSRAPRGQEVRLLSDRNLKLDSGFQQHGLAKP
jgi:hypothetical protein